MHARDKKIRSSYNKYTHTHMYTLFAKISQSEYAKACFIINEIDIAKLNLPPRCVKIIRFSSLAQPEVGAAYVTAGTLFLAGRR